MQLKNYYTISQISQMYHIGLDSLRYYEKLGILNPQRDPKNNYRIYGLEEIRRLNIITELRKLNIPFSQIAQYLSSRSTQTTIQLLKEEDHQLQQKIKQLSDYRQNISRCLTSINSYLNMPSESKPKYIYIPERSCISLERKNISDAETNYTLNEISRMTHYTIPIVGNSDCYLMTFDKKQPKPENISTQKVFFLTEADNEYANDTIPAGYYITYMIYGKTENFSEYFSLIEQTAREHHCTLTGYYLELYHVDTYETDCSEEYIVELQFFTDTDN